VAAICCARPRALSPCYATPASSAAPAPQGGVEGAAANSFNWFEVISRCCCPAATARQRELGPCCPGRLVASPAPWQCTSPANSPQGCAHSPARAGCSPAAVGAGGFRKVPQAGERAGPSLAGGFLPWGWGEVTALRLRAAMLVHPEEGLPSALGASLTPCPQRLKNP